MFKNTQTLGKYVSSITIGRLYHYYYDAKLKEQLPYWDRFPLCLPIDPYPDGWLGLNLHYVPQRTRKVILDQLLKYMEFEPQKRIVASYGFLKQTMIFEDVKPCIKRYLTEHVKSRLLEIDTLNYSKIIKMTTAQWQKGTPYRGAR